MAEVRTADGFALAEYDLRDRGPGEVYGALQSGRLRLRFATLRDTELIRLARSAARGIDFSAYPALLERVKQWEKTPHVE